MAKHEGACPVATRTFILNQAEKLKVDIKKVIESYAAEASIPVGTLKNWVYPEQTKARVDRQTEKRRSSRSSATPAPVVLTEEPPASEALAATSVEDLDKMIDSAPTAITYANRAIEQLENIKDDDPDAREAIKMVESWINNRMWGMPQ